MIYSLFFYSCSLICFTQAFPNSRKALVFCYECLGTPDKPELGDQMVIAAVSKIKKVGGDVSAWIPLVDQELGELHQNELKKTKKGKEPENEGEFVTLSEVLNWDRKSFEDKKSFMDEWIKQELSQWESNTKEVLGSKECERFLCWEPKWASIGFFNL